MKRVGLTVDNYKLEFFKEALHSKGYENIQVHPLRDEISLITVIVKDYEVKEVKFIATELEKKFISLNVQNGMIGHKADDI